MAVSTIEDLKRRLYHKLQTTEDVLNLRQCLEKVEKSALLSWTDNEGYDILHHAIMADNTEAVGMMFALGHFKAPHEPKCHSYIHLAANFGNRSVAVMLLQERPRDYSTKKTKFKWVKRPTEVPLLSADGCSSVAPLDVAASCGHVGCVRSILDVSSVKHRLEHDFDNHLSASCASNSPSALRLLLKQGPSEEEIKAAVGTALKLANAECLDVLLSCNPRLTSLFSGMNLYHVLYSYSMSFNKEWYESLLTVTSVLLKHNQSPVSTVPFRTYPLYSLICHCPTSEFRITSPYIIACMVLLLNAGVDPNFNEICFELDHSSLNVQTAFGRSAFPSSLHCLYGNVTNLLRLFADDHVPIRRFVAKGTETLLKHGADPSIIGPVEESLLSGNALFAFLKICFKLGLDERSITTFRLLTQNGSDPNIVSDGKYPVNVFIDEMLLNPESFDTLCKESAAQVTELSKEILETLTGNMAQSALVAASKVEFNGKPTNAAQRSLLKMCKAELVRKAGGVLSLRAQCRLCVLSACGWRSTAVVQLPLPLGLKQYVNSVT